MRRPRWALRPAALALVAIVAVSALAVAQRGGESGFIDEKDTTCWSCHVGWPTPLRSMYDIVPPEDAGGPLGEPFDYTVRVTNPWLVPWDDGGLIYLEPSLDLRQAPSLGFVSETPPLEETLTGSIEPEYSELMSPQRHHSVVVVPEGASSLEIAMTPVNQDARLGPDLVMRIYPGVSEPTGEPIVVDAAANGGTERFAVASPAEFRELGLAYGNWTIEAEVTILREDGSFSVVPAEVPYEVDLHARFDVGSEPVQYLIRRATVDGGSSELFRWRLQALAVPGPDEKILITVNATAFYEHTSPEKDDFGNFTKSREVPVIEKNGGAALEVESIVVDPQALAGVSLTRISEAVGYAAAFLLISSIWSGGMFGKASRRQLNRLFGSAKRRVAFHNFLSYGLTAAALVHFALFLIETAYYWTFGLIWGGLAILAMLGLGLTGALQVPMIRRWNYATWRWTHYALAVAAIAFTVVHILLDGANFPELQRALGWEGRLQDPLDPRGLF